MASLETRLMVLGAVAIFEPVNGYQIRRELVSWQIEEWAHIRPGSVYSVLGTLTARGDLERHDLVDGGRTVAVYTTTEQGTAELESLFTEAVARVRPLDPVPFHTAVAMFPLLERSLVRDLLEARVSALDALLDDLARGRSAVAREHRPPHVEQMLDHQGSLLRVERSYAERLLGLVDGGDLDFAGEPASWVPAADDPGWTMHQDRERYLGMLGR